MYRLTTSSVNIPSNADATVFEPSSMSECVQAMKGHADGFANALNAMNKFLDNEDDVMPALGVADDNGRFIFKQIKRDVMKA